MCNGASRYAKRSSGFWASWQQRPASQWRVQKLWIWWLVKLCWPSIICMTWVHWTLRDEGECLQNSKRAADLGALKCGWRHAGKKHRREVTANLVRVSTSDRYGEPEGRVFDKLNQRNAPEDRSSSDVVIYSSDVCRIISVLHRRFFCIGQFLCRLPYVLIPWRNSLCPEQFREIWVVF